MQRIGPYEVLGELARGGTGVVLRVRDPQGREVALKLQSHAGAAARLARRFRTEISVLRRLSHPNLIDVLDAGEHEDAVYLVMPLVAGEPLDRVLERGPLEPAQARALAVDLAAAVAHAHAHGVLHRDIKPSNVLLPPSGRPLLSDFGLAKDLEASLGSSSGELTQEGSFLGSPGYLPPEQARGQLDRIGPRSDVYGVGATLFAMLTGRPPYEGDSLIEVLASMTEPPPDPRTLRKGLPDDLADLCLRCLAEEPAKRPESAADLADALAGDLAAPARAGRLPIIAVAVVLVGGLGVAVTLGQGGSDGADPAPVEQVPAEPVVDEGEGPATPSTPETAESLATRFNHALALQRAGDLDGAVHEFRALTIELPQLHRGWEALGTALEQQGKDAEAVQAYTEAIALAPRNAHYWYERGRAQGRLRRNDAARADLQTALRIDPGHARAWFETASLRQDLGNATGALEAYDKAIEAEPEFETAIYNRGLLRFEQGDCEGAIADATTALGLVKAARTYCNRAAAHRQLGQIDDALRDFDAAVQLEPTFPQGWIGRGLIRAKREEWIQAEADFSEALRLTPRHPQLHFNRALARKNTGDVKGARSDLELAIAIIGTENRLSKKCRSVLKTLPSE